MPATPTGAVRWGAIAILLAAAGCVIDTAGIPGKHAVGGYEFDTTDATGAQSYRTGHRNLFDACLAVCRARKMTDIQASTTPERKEGDIQAKTAGEGKTVSFRIREFSAGTSRLYIQKKSGRYTDEAESLHRDVSRQLDASLQGTP